MKTKGRTRIARSVSLSALEDKAINDELVRRKKTEPHASVSEVVQFAIRSTYMESGRAAAYLEARDRAIEFEEDCSALLTAAGISVERGAKVSGEGHRVDILASKGRKQVIVELKSSGRRSRLELVLGQAILLKSQTRLPVVVCVPYLTEADLVQAFTLAGVKLCSPDGLVAAVEASLGK